MIKTFEEFVDDLNESINDRYLLKVVYFIAAPGSGKSAVIDALSSNRSVNVLNSDDVLIMEIGKHKEFFNIDGIKKFKIDMNTFTEVQYKKFNELRAKAKEIVSRRSKHWLDSLKALGIESTGRDVNELENQVKILKSLGYDVECVLIDVNLDVCLERNRKRDRQLTDELVKTSWQNLQDNLPKIESIFNGKVTTIQNNKNLDKEGYEKFTRELYRLGLRIFRKPLENPIGIELLDVLRKNKMKFRSDIIDVEKINLGPKYF